MAVREAVEAHESTSLNAGGSDLYDHVDPDAIDVLFEDTAGAGVTVQFTLSGVIVSIWSDGKIDIRVTDSFD